MPFANSDYYSSSLLIWMYIVVVLLLSHVRLFPSPWTAACRTSLSFTISWSLLKLIPTESVILSNHLILCCSLLHPLSAFPSIRVFSNESALHIRWPKLLKLQLQHQSFQWIFRVDLLWIDWFDLQGTLKSLLQHHNSKASILRYSAFFTVQLSHLYRITGKTIALTIKTFVGKVMSLLFNMLSRFDIAFLPRSKCLLISWLQSLSAVLINYINQSYLTVTKRKTTWCKDSMEGWMHKII